MDMVRVVKIEKLVWLRHLFGIQAQDPCRKLTILKPEDTRRVGKPKLMRRELVEDPKNRVMRNWRRMSQGRTAEGIFWKD